MPFSLKSNLFLISKLLKVQKHLTRTGNRLYSAEAKFQTKPYKLHLLDDGPSSDVSVNKEDALKYYKDMMMIRLMETVTDRLCEEKVIIGPCHLYSGQEACAVGMEAAIRKSDAVITSYRTHGWAYLRGLSVKSILSELTGKEPGCARGKGGSMHMYHDNFYGGNGIVGAQVPLGAGVAFAFNYQGRDDICLALYGDGASNQGQVFETFNIAKLWNIPVLFICENNGFAMTTRGDRASASTNYYTRGDYIPGIWVDGMDVLAVREATRFASELCRSKKGPLVMEVATYRYHGHSNRDLEISYRTDEEVQEIQETRDPISSFGYKIINANLVTADELKKVDQEVRKEVEEAVNFAKTANEIPVDELYADIYVEPIYTKIRGVTPFTEHTHKSLATPQNL